MDDIVRIGCCVCVRTGLGATPGEVHHLLRGQRRIGHLFSICLCLSHHRANLNNDVVTSRHHYRVAFEVRYGTEQELLAWSREQVGLLRAGALVPAY